MRGRVLETAAKMGYRTPQRSERRRDARGPSGATIGVLLRYMSGVVARGHARMLAGMSELTGAYDLTLAVHYVRDHELDSLIDPDRCPTLLRRPDIDGLILINEFPANVLDALTDRWPTVSITHAYHEHNLDSVHVDPTAGMVQLVDHLYEQGHRRIGFIADSRGRSWSHARHAGYTEALRRLGLFARLLRQRRIRHHVCGCNATRPPGGCLRPE